MRGWYATCYEGARRFIGGHPGRTTYSPSQRFNSMNLSTFLLILTGVLFNAGAQLLLKAGTRAIGVISADRTNAIQLLGTVSTQPYILAGLACYVLSVGIWIVALSRVDVMVAYPMLSIGYIVNALIAWQLFGEALTTTRIAGLVTIVLGVLILSRG